MLGPVYPGQPTYRGKADFVAKGQEPTSRAISKRQSD